MTEANSLLINIEKIIFPNGLVGIPEWKNFSVQQTADTFPVALLHCHDAKGLSYIVANPASWFPEYKFDVEDEDLAVIKIKNMEDLVVLAIINVEADPFQVTANLISPLLINPKEKLGVQVVLNNSPYLPRHPLTLKTMKVTLSEGLLGLPEYKNFVLQIVTELMPVMLLACQDEKRISFPVIDPWLINADYAPQLSQEDKTSLGVDNETEVSWLAILNVRNEPFEVTANLMAPIAIHPKSGMARQVILSQPGYQMMQPIKIVDTGSNPANKSG